MSKELIIEIAYLVTGVYLFWSYYNSCNIKEDLINKMYHEGMNFGEVRMATKIRFNSERFWSFIYLIGGAYFITQFIRYLA